MTLVDANVLLDLFTRNSSWLLWSVARLEEAALNGPLIINDIIYAETSIRFLEMATFDDALAVVGVTLVPMPRQTPFLAGKAFERYRASGGTRQGVLPDFFIGAHAAVEGLPLLTRDTKRYRTYFPTVTLIAPDDL